MTVKRATSFALFALILSTATAFPQAQKMPNGKFRILVTWVGFEAVADRKTGEAHFVFTLQFRGIPQDGTKKLRRGDEVSGIKVGEFVHRTPIWLATDGYEKGTLPTLELIHLASGAKILLEPTQNMPL